MYLRDTLGYIAGQMLGAIAGTWLGVLAWGRWARQVGNAALHPGPTVGYGWAFAAEVGTTFALTLAIYTFVSHKSLARWTPAMATLVVGILVWLDGNFSGCGMNPARWFGPALSIPYWGFTLVYVLGPIAGAILAALLRRTGILTNPIPHTGKVYHDERYRSVFKKDSLPSTPPAQMP
jgi:glycerol uptake facilitator-like aquaporin